MIAFLPTRRKRIALNMDRTHGINTPKNVDKFRALFVMFAIETLLFNSYLSSGVFSSPDTEPTGPAPAPGEEPDRGPFILSGIVFNDIGTAGGLPLLSGVDALSSIPPYVCFLCVIVENRSAQNHR